MTCFNLKITGVRYQNQNKNINTATNFCSIFFLIQINEHTGSQVFERDERDVLGTVCVGSYMFHRFGLV